MFITWILVYFVQGTELTLGSYPNKQMCEEVIARATNKRAQLECIGRISKNPERAKLYRHKNWF